LGAVVGSDRPSVLGAGSLANALSGAQQTELVAIGIGHDHPIDLALAEVYSSRAERDQTVNLRSLITGGGRRDVEMKPVLRDLPGNRRAPGDERTGDVCADKRMGTKRTYSLSHPLATMAV